MINRFLLFLYRLLLHLYPPGFRQVYEEEMLVVFQDLLANAEKQGLDAIVVAGLRELLHAPLVIPRLYRFLGRKRHSKSAISLPAYDIPGSAAISIDGRTSWQHAVLEVTPFLFFAGTLLLLTYPSFVRLDPGWFRHVNFIGWLAVFVSVPAILIGVARGLPRWSYPYTGFLFGCFLLAAYRSGMGLFLVAASLVSIGIAIAVVLLDNRMHFLPAYLASIHHNIRIYRTRLSFSAYGLAPLWILSAFDDGFLNDRTPYLALAVLFMVLGAAIYTRSRKPATQFLALLVGLSFAIWIAVLDQITFASSQDVWGANIGWRLSLWIPAAVAICAPLILGAKRRAGNPG